VRGPPSRLKSWRRWRAPRSLKVTRIGRTFLVITLGIGLGALNTGNNLLYLVLGFLLSVILLSGVLSERVLKDITVRRLLPDGVFAGEPFALRYEVTRDRGRAFALKLTERPGTVDGWAWVPTVAAGAKEIARAAATAPRRGPVKLTELTVSTFFPFGLFEKSRTLAIEDLLLVWPRRGFTCEVPKASAGVHVGDLGRSPQRDGGGDLLGLRELADDDDARRVHWKKSAAVGQLLKVEREREDRQQFTLRVEPQDPGDGLDRACEETAALTHALLLGGHEVGLEAFGKRIRPSAGMGHEKRLLAALAWLGFEAPEPRT